MDIREHEIDALRGARFRIAVGVLGGAALRAQAGVQVALDVGGGAAGAGGEVHVRVGGDCGAEGALEGAGDEGGGGGGLDGGDGEGPEEG